MTIFQLKVQILPFLQLFQKVRGSQSKEQKILTLGSILGPAFELPSFEEPETPLEDNIAIVTEQVISILAKGELISKCLFGVIVWTKTTTFFFSGFLPQPLKRGQIKNIKALYYTNQGLFNIFGIIKFLIQPIFRGQGRNPEKKFVGFLVQKMTPMRHFEIN